MLNRKSSESLTTPQTLRSDEQVINQFRKMFPEADVRDYGGFINAMKES